MAADVVTAVLALTDHYIDYLTSTGVLLTLLLVVVPIVFGVLLERAATAASEASFQVPGCRRLGFPGQSNLHPKAQRESEAASKHGGPYVQALLTYPVKSCRGVELTASEVEASGLKYDRLFTFAQLVPKQGKGGKDANETDNCHWRFITQREYPKLALLRTELWVPDPRGKRTKAEGRKKQKLQAPTSQPRPRSRTRGSTLVGQLEKGGDEIANSVSGVGDWTAEGGCLVIRFPFEPAFNPLGLRTEHFAISLPLKPTPQRAETKHYSNEELSIWTDDARAVNVTTEIRQDALAKLRLFLGVNNQLGLFRVDDTQKRAVIRFLPNDRPNETYNLGFADAFPTNLLGLASVRATDEQLPSSAQVKGKLGAIRFRANVYIAGIPAFEEDNWKRITVGRRIGRDQRGLFEADAEYHIACRTARCKLPNVDPETGVKDMNQPYSTLSRTRQVDEGANPHPCLGMQTIPLFERGIIRVGDKVEVLDTGEHRYEKMFP